ncbi:hypothetical protein RHSIM_Rhsim02G0221500 [Rhododendron simsii]|uniref:Uncharacterized protein n=1 Tax=Rhododendron simsii TaxID=118357 RepID=A0A834LW40_RHOSS|nr:hypothetical protein RHSIM_Rhsim02G0221500 [Rhododendron simsii]
MVKKWASSSLGGFGASLYFFSGGRWLLFRDQGTEPVCGRHYMIPAAQANTAPPNLDEQHDTCANNNPKEAADPEPEVELVVAKPVRAAPAVVVGLDPNVIDLFPLLPFMIDGPVGFEGSECQICLEQFVHGEISSPHMHVGIYSMIIASKRGWPAEQNALFVAMSI